MIELAGANLCATLADLHARSFATAWSAHEIAKLMDNPAVFALIAREHEPQGFVMAWAAAGDAEILTLAVVPEARQRGVGAALATAAATAALVRGAASVHLEVAETNQAARALYAKLGYEEAGRRHAYYAGEGGSVDAIVMRRALPRPPV